MAVSAARGAGRGPDSALRSGGPAGPAVPHPGGSRAPRPGRRLRAPLPALVFVSSRASGPSAGPLRGRRPSRPACPGSCPQGSRWVGSRARGRSGRSAGPGGGSRCRGAGRRDPRCGGTGRRPESGATCRGAQSALARSKPVPSRRNPPSPSRWRPARARGGAPASPSPPAPGGAAPGARMP